MYISLFLLYKDNLDVKACFPFYLIFYESDIHVQNGKRKVQMYAEKLAAPHAMTPTAIQCRGSSPPPPPPPHHSKVGKYGMISHRQFYFHILKPSSGCYFTDLPEEFAAALLDSIAKWSVILHFFVLNKNNYPPGLLSMF